MKTRFVCLTALGLLLGGAAFAAAPAGAPAGTTGLCKDGAYTSAAQKQGACHGHKGVQDWYGAAAPAVPTAPATPAAPAAPVARTAPSAAPATAAVPAVKAAPAVVPAVAAAPAAPAKADKPAAFSPAATPAPGGGLGTVWVNASSKTYHCASDKWYGRTKKGEYMKEADAQAKGFHADHGKACAS